MRILCLVLLSLILAGPAVRAQNAGSSPLDVQIERVGDAPIIRPDMLPAGLGDSINGPSMIRVPDWVEHPLGRYYLYFAHHRDDHIRMAYADDPEGPFTVLEGGVLRIGEQSAVGDHIASPDVVIDEANRRIVMFYHGANLEAESPQMTAAVTSSDGVHFTSLGGPVARAYLRVFQHDGQWFGFNHGGTLLRAEELGKAFEPVGRMIGPEIAAAVDPDLLGEPGATPAADRPQGGRHRYGLRHVGLDVTGDHLVIYFSCVGHRPERILCTFVDLRGAPEQWRAQGVVEVLRSETAWEGADLPLAYSEGGISLERVRQLRDPQVFREGERAWLLYSVAGENGIGLARVRYVPISSAE